MKIIVLLFAILLFVGAQRWKKDDKACQNIRCQSKFRCQNGLCIKQERQAIKKLCVNPKLTAPIRSIKCEKSIEQGCVPTRNLLSCGFTKDGLKKDFTDDCSPCLDKNIKYYFRIQCSDAPAVCKQNEECINGQCRELFSKDQDRNRKICILSSDCKPVQICVASKCVHRQELLQEFAKNKTRYE